MKTIKIFALPSHTFVDRVSGVDYVRIIQPMKYLDGYKDNEVKFEVTVYDHSKNRSFDWRDVFEKNDAVYFNYTSNDVGYAVMGLMAQKYKKKLICDVDDDLFTILTDNPAYDIFKKGSWGRTVIEAILNDVHYVTCTNPHLKHSIEYHTKKTADKIEVFPNYIDLSLYKHRCPFKDRPVLKALHFGSTTHFASLYSQPFIEAIGMIMENYPNFHFKTVGAFIPKFRDKYGQRYEQGYGDSDLMKWIKMMPEIMDDADFMVVPVLNNTYNRSKSSIKFLEASSYRMPGIYQRIRQYNEIVQDGVNGFLCSTTEEWYTAIKTMLDNASVRKSMGKKAFETIQDWQIQRHVKDYAEYFKKLLLTSV
jgi:glycosyltransferase involved in cell wall biosynthesis